MAIQEYTAPLPTNTPAITLKDIAWFAGIMEGEGSFFYRRSQPVLKVSMSDRDIMERVARLFGNHRLGSYQPKGKDTYKLSISLVIKNQRQGYARRKEAL